MRFGPLASFAPGKARLKRAIDLTREVLQVPADYRIGIVPASDNGCRRNVPCGRCWRARRRHAGLGKLGEGWVTDVVKQLKLKDVRKLLAPYGALPDLASVDFSRDVVFTLERHDLGRPRRRCVVDSGRSRRPHHLRRDIGGLRARPRLREARCGDLLMAESAGRGGGTWCHHPVAPRGGAA